MFGVIYHTRFFQPWQPMIWSLATEKKNFFEFVDVSGTRWLTSEFQVCMKTDASPKNLTILSWLRWSERQASSVSAGKAALDPIFTKTSNQLWIQKTDKYIKKIRKFSSKKNPCSFMCWPSYLGCSTIVEFYRVSNLTPRTACRLVNPNILGSTSLGSDDQLPWQFPCESWGMVNQ